MSSENGNGDALAIVEVPILNGVMSPTNVEGLWRIAQLIARSGFKPKGVDTPEQVFVAVGAGLEVGLSPMQSIQNIMVVNGRPSLWGDALLGLVQASGKMTDMKESFEGKGDSLCAVCHVERADRSTPVVQRFSVADAKLAGLWGKSGPWTQYPKRMLQMRARAFALRDTFPDVLKGLSAAEETMDYTIVATADGTEVIEPRDQGGLGTQGLRSVLKSGREKIKADKARTEDKPKETVKDMQARVEARREEMIEGAPASESDPPHTDDVPTSEMTPEKFAESLRAETKL